MSQNDGGPAFPVALLSGMSLRDYFAAAALTGLLADGGDNTWEKDAENAYKVADEMLRARGGK